MTGTRYRIRLSRKGMIVQQGVIACLCARSSATKTRSHVRRLVFLLFIYLIEASAVAETAVSPAGAIKHVGESATVCGRVASAHFAAASRGAPTFLNLDKPYPQQVFTVVIWGNSRPRFSYRPEKLDGQDVCITGMIGSYRGKVQIEVSDPSQLQVQRTRK